MILIAVIGTYIPLTLVFMFPVSEFEIVSYIAVAIFGIIMSIEITLYSKVRKEIA